MANLNNFEYCQMFKKKKWQTFDLNEKRFGTYFR